MTYRRIKMNDEALIELVKQNSVLYNPDHMLYFDNVHKHRLWTFIASHFKNADVESCKRKWKVLQDHYKRHVRLNDKRNHGKHINKFKYARNMSFMEDYCMSDDEVDQIHKSKTHFAFYTLSREQYESLIDITDAYYPNMRSGQASTSAEPKFEFDRNGQIILEDYDDDDEEATSSLQNLQTVTFKGFPNNAANMAKVEVFRVVSEYEMIRICGTDPRTLGRTLRLADTSEFPPFDVTPPNKTYATYLHNDNVEPEGGSNN